MQGLTDLFWRPIPDVRIQERPRFLFFAGLATLVSLAQTLGLTGAEALFMAEFGTQYLPMTFVGGSAATVLTFSLILIFSAVALLAAIAGLVLEFPGVSAFLICFFFVTQAIFVNHLWTFTTDYFDTVASKRLIPLFTIGGSVGGVIGGLLAAGTTGILGATSPIVGWAVFLFASACLIRIGRKHLRSWGPIDLEEADETSVEGIRGALRYVRSSTLGFALLISAIGMVFALVMARYMWLDTFAQRFPDPAELARFIGLFLAATNVIEIAIEMTITPWLIRRMGVPTTNIVHPILTLFSFGGLAYQYNVVSGAIARMNGEMLENALANPIRALLCGPFSRESWFTPACRLAVRCCGFLAVRTPPGLQSQEPPPAPSTLPPISRCDENTCIPWFPSCAPADSTSPTWERRSATGRLLTWQHFGSSCLKRKVSIPRSLSSNGFRTSLIGELSNP